MVVWAKWEGYYPVTVDYAGSKPVTTAKCVGVDVNSRKRLKKSSTLTNQICKRLYAASQLHSPAKRLVMVRVHALPPTMGVWCKGSTVRNQAESGKYKLRLSCQPQPATLQGQELTVTSNKLGAHVLMVAREVCTFSVVSSTLTVSTNLWEFQEDTKDRNLGRLD